MVTTRTKRDKTLREDAKAEALRLWLESLGHRQVNLELLSADELGELRDLWWKKVGVREYGIIGPVAGRLSYDDLTDAEYGRWLRLVAQAKGARPRGERTHDRESFHRKLGRLAASFLASDEDDADLEPLRRWAVSAESSGRVLASKLLRDEVVAGVLESADVAVLAWCLWAIQDAGGGEAVVSTRAPRLGMGPMGGRSFKTCVDHLTVNEWVDSKPEGRDTWRVRFGPSALAAAAQAERWDSIAKEAGVSAAPTATLAKES